jgi:ribonuclease HII
MKTFKYIVGIDEVGRGPLAGPIAFCAFKMPISFNARSFGKIRDSKLLTAQKREEIFCKLEKLKKEKIVDYAVCMESAKRIDHINIAEAGKLCIKKSLEKIKANPKECLVLLDGGIKAPKKYINQKTIIGGDKKERAIAFASIIAKVKRDELMCKLAKKYPEYGFEVHKGYGTKKHCEILRIHGMCPEHRRSFCKKIVVFDKTNL